MHKTFQGTQTAYRLLHYWVESQLGKPSKCESCGTTKTPQGKSKYFHWANISGDYKKSAEDWKRLCALCHSKFDNDDMCRKKLHRISGDNIKYVARGRRCRACHNSYMNDWFKRYRLARRELKA